VLWKSCPTPLEPGDNAERKRGTWLRNDVDQALSSLLPGLGTGMIEMDGALEGNFGGLGERF
jgi:hypothetical protein